MSSVTLVWVSKPGNAFQTLAIPRKAIYVMAGGFCFFFLFSIIMLGMNLSYSSANSFYIQENSKLTQLVSNKEAENLELKKNHQNLVNKFFEFQAIEDRIRMFLGLENDREEGYVTPYQGGTGTLDWLSYEPDGIICQNNMAKATCLSELSISELQNSLLDVLTYLEEKQEESEKIPMILPVDNKDSWISGSFGWRENPFTGTGREFHNGLDISAPWRTPIIAPADGKVVRTGNDRSLGNFVRIKHNKQYATLYGHMNEIAVKRGKKIKRGDLIGYMGNTGRSTGVHLHYSVVKDKKFIDPINYIWNNFGNNLTMNQ